MEPRTDDFRAAARIFGLFVAGGLVVAALVLVAGFRWAAGSALQDPTAQLETAVRDASADLSARADALALRLADAADRLDAAADRLDGRAASLELGLRSELALATESLTEAFRSGVDDLADVAESRLTALDSTARDLLSGPFPVDLPEPVRIQGVGQDAPKLAVDVNVLGGD